MLFVRCNRRFSRAIQLAVFAIACAAFGAAPAWAVQIESSPQNTAGGFRHNAFHTAGTQGGQGGTVLAWFDLDTTFGAANDWDLGTGLLTAHFDIFDDETLSTAIGTAVATGTVPPACCRTPSSSACSSGSDSYRWGSGDGSARAPDERGVAGGRPGLYLQSPPPAQLYGSQS